MSIECCNGMEILKEMGFIEIKEENVDEKGFITTVSLLGRNNTTIWIRHCPCCGGIIQNVEVPPGKCTKIEEQEPFDEDEERIIF